MVVWTRVHAHWTCRVPKVVRPTALGHLRKPYLYRYSILHPPRSVANHAEYLSARTAHRAVLSHPDNMSVACTKIVARVIVLRWYTCCRRLDSSELIERIETLLTVSNGAPSIAISNSSTFSSAGARQCTYGRFANVVKPPNFAWVISGVTMPITA